MSSQTPLSIAILRTVSYYDVHDYPLTNTEIWRWLFPEPRLRAQPWNQTEVETELERLITARTIERRGAYVFLSGREAIVALRTERAERSVKLWRRATSTARYLELVPGIRMVAVVNTLAIDNVKPTSDIDFLIVTSPGLLWMTRALVTGIVTMLGYRRHGIKIAGRVCLSFYLTTNALDLAPLKREDQDTHFAFWATQAVPLLDDGIYEKFVKANGWITQQLPNAWTWDWRKNVLAPNASLRAIKQFYEIFFATPIGNWFIAFARDRQLKKMNANTHSKAKDGTTDVVISEDVLKFHEADRRLAYNAAWRERLMKLGLSV